MYCYNDYKTFLLTDEGQRALITSWATFQGMLSIIPEIQLDSLMGGEISHLGIWQQMAVVERLVELGFLREVRTFGVPTQHRRFRRA